VLVRFVVSRKDGDSGVRQGLFQAAHGLLRGTDDLPAYARGRLEGLLAWFGANLSRPRRLARSRRPRPAPKAICWFEPTATEHLDAAGEVAAILAGQGLDVAAVTTDRPGYVVYEDEHQIAAEPFRDTGA
jgi:hypothetical protein